MEISKAEVVRQMAVLHSQLWQIPPQAVNDANQMRIIYGKLHNFSFGLLVAMALVGQADPKEVNAIIESLSDPTNVPVEEPKAEKKGKTNGRKKKTK